MFWTSYLATEQVKIRVYFSGQLKIKKKLYPCYDFFGQHSKVAIASCTGLVLATVPVPEGTVLDLDFTQHVAIHVTTPYSDKVSGLWVTIVGSGQTQDWLILASSLAFNMI